YEKNIAILTHNERVEEKLMKYLKSDTYLYAPLGNVRHCDNVLVKNVIFSPRAEELEFTKVTRTVISKKIALEKKRGAEDPIGDKQGDLSKGGRRDIGILSPPTPEIPQGKKQATPRCGYVDSVRMSNVMQGLRSKILNLRGANARRAVCSHNVIGLTFVNGG
ncbi:hypothetical protein KSS87_008853, partial [Heliosperma pusillum]